MSNEQVVDVFKKQYEALAGHVHLAMSNQQVVSSVEKIIGDTAVERVACASIQTDLQQSIEETLNSNVECIKAPFNRSDLPHLIDTAQIGISYADFAIAEAGALVEISTNDEVRLVSTLPRTHICIVRSDQILMTLEEAAPRLRQAFANHEQGCVATFISGPSRTGDIEMILTLGVHGPEVSHVIILDEEQP